MQGLEFKKKNMLKAKFNRLMLSTPKWRQYYKRTCLSFIVENVSCYILVFTVRINACYCLYILILNERTFNVN